MRESLCPKDIELIDRVFRKVLSTWNPRGSPELNDLHFAISMRAKVPIFSTGIICKCVSKIDGFGCLVAWSIIESMTDRMKSETGFICDTTSTLTHLCGLIERLVALLPPFVIKLNNDDKSALEKSAIDYIQTFNEIDKSTWNIEVKWILLLYISNTASKLYHKTLHHFRLSERSCLYLKLLSNSGDTNALTGSYQWESYVSTNCKWTIDGWECDIVC